MSDCARSASDRILAACPASSSAASVSLMPRPLRSRSCAPVSRSSFASCCDTAEVVTCRACAAAVIEPLFATARSTRSRSRFNILVILRCFSKNNSLVLIRAASHSGCMLPVTSVGWRARFFTLAVIWGLSFLFIKEAVQALAPLQVVAGRMVIGTATLLAFLAARRERLPRGIRTWAHLSVAATLNNVLPFTLFAYAELRIGSALAGICNASAPLFAALVALAALPDERLSRRRGLGLLLGFCGVFVVLGAWDGLAGHDLAGALLALGGGLCYGIGFPYTRRFLTGTGNSSLSLAAGQLLCGSAMLAVRT